MGQDATAKMFFGIRVHCDGESILPEELQEALFSRNDGDVWDNAIFERLGLPWSDNYSERIKLLESQSVQLVSNYCLDIEDIYLVIQCTLVEGDWDEPKVFTLPHVDEDVMEGFILETAKKLGIENPPKPQWMLVAGLF